MNAPMEDFLVTVLPRPADMVGHSGAATPKSFFCLPNFVVLGKNFFKHMIKTIIFPPYKCILPPNLCNLATGVVLQLGYFVLKVIRL